MIIEASLNHSEPISRLSSELGYATTRSKVEENLSVILGQPTQKVWVYLVDEQVCGWCHAGLTRWVMMESMVEVFGLVVSSKIRNKGIGRQLITKVEEWAREKGVEEVWIRSNRKRKESHPFYLAIGYTNIKDQAVYVKKV